MNPKFQVKQTGHSDGVARYEVRGTTSSGKEFSEVLLVETDSPDICWENENLDNDPELAPGDGSDWDALLLALEEGNVEEG